MKLHINIPQVFAKSVTHPRTMSDEIYVCYFISLAKSPSKINSGDKDGKGDDKTLVRKYVAKRLSKVRKKVDKGTRWCPEDMWVDIDTEDSDILFITMAVYEYDSGDIYKELHKKTTVVEPSDFDWSSIELPVDFTNYMSWVKCIWKAIVASFNYFKQDDLLAQQTIAIKLNDKSTSDALGYRELKFKNFGGEYRVQLVVDTQTHNEWWG